MNPSISVVLIGVLIGGTLMQAASEMDKSAEKRAEEEKKERISDPNVN